MIQQFGELHNGKIFYHLGLYHQATSSHQKSLLQANAKLPSWHVSSSLSTCQVKGGDTGCPRALFVQFQQQRHQMLLQLSSRQLYPHPHNSYGCGKNLGNTDFNRRGWNKWKLPDLCLPPRLSTKGTRIKGCSQFFMNLHLRYKFFAPSVPSDL